VSKVPLTPPLAPVLLKIKSWFPKVQGATGTFCHQKVTKLKAEDLDFEPFLTKNGPF